MPKTTDTDRINWLEEEVNRGACPALINDDNGHWALSFNGFQNVVTGRPKDVSTTFFVKAKAWKNTVRQAIDATMKQRAKS